ncbi:conjugal transfer protein TraH (plasmid) [Aureimonas sp. SA4125]|uniref:conjugal transfer protein TraH n=1 Tax=Aureimonas sp. SA4125 TaxID=2826993 RepID=UPI001CC3AF3E|nr:conjugal transfer protein TraH [Aureimonas sp. SA4125]BDA87195.1 conjugal transfer protein TraH [Aureimonas sp. SA4125]
MIDAALIHECSDSALPPAIVEKFVAAAGSLDPLAISVRAGNRVILVPAPKTAAEALDLVRHYVGYAVVRVGVTQYPAGFGISEASEVSPDLVDACANVRLGTALFGKVYRIVEMRSEASPETVFEHAAVAWRTGSYRGKAVFTGTDPVEPDGKSENDDAHASTAPEDQPLPHDRERDLKAVGEVLLDGDDANSAGIRINLSGIGVGE